MKLFATWTEKIDDFHDCKGITVSEEGEIITGHYSSSIAFLKNDLGAEPLSIAKGMCEAKRKDFDKKYGEGNWSIEWVEELPKEVEQKMKTIQEKSK